LKVDFPTLQAATIQDRHTTVSFTTDDAIISCIFSWPLQSSQMTDEYREIVEGPGNVD
jgi:hypothetical protein